MLPLAIEDIKTRLLLGDGQTKKDEAPLSLGVLSMDEHGELKILEAPKENKKNWWYWTTMPMQDWFRQSKRLYGPEWGRKWVCEVPGCENILPSGFYHGERRRYWEEVSNYNSYLEFYKRSKDDFIKTVKPLVEKLWEYGLSLSSIRETARAWDLPWWFPM